MADFNDLLFIIKTNNKNALKEVLNSGFNVNSLDVKSLFTTAVLYGCLDCIQLLLDNGATLSEYDADELVNFAKRMANQALNLASEARYSTIIDILKRRFNNKKRVWSLWGKNHTPRNNRKYRKNS